MKRALIGRRSVATPAALTSSDDPKTDRGGALHQPALCQGRRCGGSDPQDILFLEELLGGREDYLLNHPWYRLNVVVVRSRGFLEHDTRGRLGLGLMSAISANMVSRRHLGRYMERGILHDGRVRAPVSKLVDFPSHEVALTGKTCCRRCWPLHPFRW